MHHLFSRVGPINCNPNVIMLKLLYADGELIAVQETSENSFETALFIIIASDSQVTINFDID